MFGTVSRFTRQFGFGFVVPDDPNEPCYFVHHSFIQANPAKRFLVAGQRVEFDPVEVDGKPQAYNVRKIGDAPRKQGVRQ